MTNQEDSPFCLWMAPLLKMTAEHLAAPMDQPRWPWIDRLTPREMARLLMRLLDQAETLDLRPTVEDKLLIWLGTLWHEMWGREQAKWEAAVMEARARSLTARQVIPAASSDQALTPVASKEDPTT